jgi:hypothetical protein
MAWASEPESPPAKELLKSCRFVKPGPNLERKLVLLTSSSIRWVARLGCLGVVSLMIFSGCRYVRGWRN